MPSSTGLGENDTDPAQDRPDTPPGIGKSLQRSYNACKQPDRGETGMRSIISLCAAAALISCTESGTVSRNAPGVFTPGLNAPKDAAPGTCWDKTETPAVVQTVTEDVLVQPARISSTGTVQAPPIYRSENRQIIVQERKTTWFQTVCPANLTPDFVASVQRALQIRGLYNGPETGRLDAATQGALRRFQVQEQINIPDPGTLSVEAAKRMGLWTADRPA